MSQKVSADRTLGWRGKTPSGRVSGIRAVRNASDLLWGAKNFPSLGGGNFLETSIQGNFDRGETTDFEGPASKNQMQDLFESK